MSSKGAKWGTMSSKGAMRSYFETYTTRYFGVDYEKQKIKGLKRF